MSFDDSKDLVVSYTDEQLKEIRLGLLLDIYSMQKETLKYTKNNQLEDSNNIFCSIETEPKNQAEMLLEIYSLEMIILRAVASGYLERNEKSFETTTVDVDSIMKNLLEEARLEKMEKLIQIRNKYE